MRDLNDEAMKEFTFEHPAVVFEYDEHHGGDDVGLWATGPMSYLFHKSHEQSYSAHVVSENIRCLILNWGMDSGPAKIFLTHEARTAQGTLGRKVIALQF